MAKLVTQFDLLVSCPSDVKEELEIIKETVDSFNRMFGAVNNANILIKHWSTDSYPQSGGAPQTLLNKQFVLECDAAVAVFWTRFGTPTDEYGSGTEEEIEELINSGKQVFLYFSDCQLNPSSIDNKQYQRVLSFRDKYKDKGIFWTYTSVDDFKKSFLNHISLYFVKILANEDTKLKTDKSKISIKGVTKGKLADQPVMFKRDYLNIEFILNMRHSISQKIEQAKKTVLIAKVVIEPEKPVHKEMTIGKAEFASKLGELTTSWQDQFNNIGKLFPSSKVIISEKMKQVISNYAQENGIDLNYDEFFNIGDLVKHQQLLGGAPLGMGQSYNYVGTEEEKNRYELIRELYWDIHEYSQYIEYFTKITEKYYLKLALSNSGTNYDEDVDVKIFIKKGLLCLKEQLPFPGDDILQTINKIFDVILFKPHKSISVSEYDDYPIVPSTPFIPSLGLNGVSHEDKVKANKNEYKNKVETIFCYDYFQDEEYDIICYNQRYIKQNTSVFLPSFLVFNASVDEINYEISSKHCSQVIKEQLHILNDV